MRIFILLLACALTTVAPAAEPPEGAVPAIRMSPYEVSANSVKFDHWIKVSSLNFVIYTDANPIEAMAMVRQMEMLHIGAQAFFGRTAWRRSPSIFVLPTSNSDWRKLEHKGSVEWRVAISDPAHTVVDLVIAHYDWQAHGLGMVFAEIGAAELYWLNLPQPLWFERGVMAFFEAAEITKDSVTLGHGNQRIWAVLNGGWLTWPRLFAVTEESPEYRRESEFQRFKGQCIAFVQYLMTNKDSASMDRLMTWVSMTDAGHEPSEAAFKSVFGQDWKAWQKTMTTYLSGGTNRVQSLRLKPEMLRFEIVQASASPREMRELFVLGQILNQNLPASPLSLDAILAKDLHTDSLREVLVEACLAWKRDAAADAHLQRLMGARSSNPAIYALAARRLFDSKVPKVTASSRLGAEIERIREWCSIALALEPRQTEANNLLALSHALAPEVSEASVQAIEGIYRTLSGNAPTPTVISALAIAQLRAGNPQAAHATADLIAGSPFADAVSRGIASAIRQVE